MSEFIAAQFAAHASADLIRSATPGAPVVVDTVHVPATRRWTAGRLRSLARAAYALSNRVDPARLAGHRLA